MLWNGLFVSFVIAAVVIFTLLLTHRVAGPARVLEHALDGMCDNVFDRRCKVRRRDYLSKLSRSVARLSDKLRIDRKRLVILLDRVDLDVASGNVDDAREKIRAFRDEWELDDASAEAEAEAESETGEPAVF